MQLLFAGLPSSLLATLLLLSLTVAATHIAGTIAALPACLGILVVTIPPFFGGAPIDGAALLKTLHGQRGSRSDRLRPAQPGVSGAVRVFPAGDVAAQAFIAFVIAGVFQLSNPDSICAPR